MSIVFDTPDGIAFFRLTALKGALSLQVKGMKLSRGQSATAIGKRDYGIQRNTASGQLPIVEEVVESLLRFRECAPAMQEHLGRTFTGILNAITDEGKSLNRSTIEVGVRVALHHNQLTLAEAQVVRGLAAIWLFEQGTKPAARVLFRA